MTNETTPDAVEQAIASLVNVLVNECSHTSETASALDVCLANLRHARHAERARHAEEMARLEEQFGKLSELYDVTQERLEDFEEREPDARLCAEWAATVALKATDVYSAARRYLCGESRGIVAQVQQENDSLRDQLREVTAELDGERERATKMEAELADRRAHDEDVRTCLEYCDEDDPTPGGIGGLARELLKWLRGFEGDVE